MLDWKPPASPPDGNGSRVLVQRVTMSTSVKKLEVDVENDKRASHFFSNVQECISANFEKIKRGISPQFGWIKVYQTRMQPAKQVKEPTDPFGMTSFNASLEEPRKNRQTVATTHLIPLRPAPRPHSPGSIGRQPR
ncbi:putative inositol polyphosphate 5-phosphatase OCRL-1 [Apostichopus japonicus]|uniref:Putative inositol polyphosphate 5-phosphatase OCRL-1 n=1 Tax=Stichopus japonicus TaxID=307972 RepID=A0A2G8JXT9_STIJA|nr:putative inositol polyphosphate 5-phosphatase OCRL-1 [Apostichopus japonicus]